MDLEVPAPWPTARMRKREEMIYRERRREVLLVREQFEVRMEHLARARDSACLRQLFGLCVFMDFAFSQFKAMCPCRGLLVRPSRKEKRLNFLFRGSIGGEV